MLLLVLTAGVAACGQPPIPSPAAAPTPTLAAAPTAVPTLTPPPMLPSPQTSSGATGPTVPVDPTLLGVLPVAVDGIPFVESHEAEAAAAADPHLPLLASGFVAALALDPGTGDFAFAVVLRLKPGALDDQRFRDYRAAFDQGACSQANGLTGTTVAEIGGRAVYVGTCAGGFHTYHVWLAPQGFLVSATSTVSTAGDRRLGEILMEHLRMAP